MILKKTITRFLFFLLILVIGNYCQNLYAASGGPCNPSTVSGACGDCAACLNASGSKCSKGDTGCTCQTSGECSTSKECLDKFGYPSSCSGETGNTTTRCKCINTPTPTPTPTPNSTPSPTPTPGMNPCGSDPADTKKCFGNQIKKCDGTLGIYMPFDDCCPYPSLPSCQVCVDPPPGGNPGCSATPSPTPTPTPSPTPTSPPAEDPETPPPNPSPSSTPDCGGSAPACDGPCSNGGSCTGLKSATGGTYCICCPGHKDCPKSACDQSLSTGCDGTCASGACTKKQAFIGGYYYCECE